MNTNAMNTSAATGNTFGHGLGRAWVRAGLCLLAALSTMAAGCDILQQAPAGPNASGVVCVWLSANKDTYASFGRVGEEAERTFGAHGSLVVATGPLGRKIAYVDFTRPVFPEGTEILLAKLELYHGGRNEDGSSDDITFSVGPVRNEPWSPATLNWNNRPDRGGMAPNEFPLYLRSQAWSGTRDIAGHVREMFGRTDHFGFVVSHHDPSSGRQVEKGFSSNNDISRKQNDQGRAPRLLLKIKLPPGATTSDIVLPFLPADHDLERLAQPVLMMRFVQADEFPASWQASPER